MVCACIPLLGSKRDQAVFPRQTRRGDCTVYTPSHAQTPSTLLLPLFPLSSPSIATIIFSKARQNSLYVRYCIMVAAAVHVTFSSIRFPPPTCPYSVFETPNVFLVWSDRRSVYVSNSALDLLFGSLCSTATRPINRRQAGSVSRTVQKKRGRGSYQGTGKWDIDGVFFGSVMCHRYIYTETKEKSCQNRCRQSRGARGALAKFPSVSSRACRALECASKSCRLLLLSRRRRSIICLWGASLSLPACFIDTSTEDVCLACPSSPLLCVPLGMPCVKLEEGDPSQVKIE